MAINTEFLRRFADALRQEIEDAEAVEFQALENVAAEMGARRTTTFLDNSGHRVLPWSNTARLRIDPDGICRPIRR